MWAFLSQSHSGGICLPSSLSRFLCHWREKWAVAGRGSGVDRAAPPARRGRCGAERWPRSTPAGAGAGFGASGGCGLGSGGSGFPPRRRGAWASPGPRSRLGVSALAMAGPAPVRARRGPSAGAGAGPRAARAAAWGPQQSRVRARGARLRHRRQWLLSLLPKQSERHRGLGFRRLQWCPAGSRCHDLAFIAFT